MVAAPPQSGIDWSAVAAALAGGYAPWREILPYQQLFLGPCLVHAGDGVGLLAEDLRVEVPSPTLQPLYDLGGPVYMRVGPRPMVQVRARDLIGPQSAFDALLALKGNDLIVEDRCSGVTYHLANVFVTEAGFRVQHDGLCFVKDLAAVAQSAFC